MNDFISPSIESLVRKRAGGRCEWETSTWQYEDITRCGGAIHLRCIKTDVNKDNEGPKLLCPEHYDEVLALKKRRKRPKKRKLPPLEQTGLFD